jgi:hypothetical protein
MNSPTAITYYNIFWTLDVYIQYQCVPVTTAWRVSKLQMEERSPIWRAAANMLNKQTRAANKGWSSSLGAWGGSNNPSP